MTLLFIAFLLVRVEVDNLAFALVWAIVEGKELRVGPRERESIDMMIQTLYILRAAHKEGANSSIFANESQGRICALVWSMERVESVVCKRVNQAQRDLLQNGGALDERAASPQRGHLLGDEEDLKVRDTHHASLTQPARLKHRVHLAYCTLIRDQHRVDVVQRDVLLRVRDRFGQHRFGMTLSNVLATPQVSASEWAFILEIIPE